MTESKNEDKPSASPNSTKSSPVRLKRKPPAKKKGDGDADQPKTNWLLISMIVGVLLWLVWINSTNPRNVGSTVKYMFLWKQVEDQNVEEVTFHGEVVTGKWKKVPENPEKGGRKLAPEFNSVLPIPDDHALLKLMRDSGVKVAGTEQQPGQASAFVSWLLFSMLLLGIMWMVLRRVGDPMSGGMMSNFIRSPAKRYQASDVITTFEDVAAMEGAKRELQEIVEFLKIPAKFQKLGAQIPKGVLLMGPPGNGKTLLARATAGEAGVPFFSINGSEFIQMFVGVGASRVRDMFRTAKENSPSILFVDEIDAVGRVRGAGLGGGHDEREQTLNQILSEMDGFQPSEAVIVVAATNRPDVLDPALLRPGRFDRHVTVEKANKAGREAILKVHCRKVPLADDVNLADIAGGSIGFSGAELKNLVNESALQAARANRDQVTREDFDAARDKVLMGPRRDEAMNKQELEMTAYHEAGHALLAWILPEVDRVHKVTVIPRGRALGVTQLMPSEDRYNIGEKRLHSQLAFMLGGRAAEKLIFDEYSAGAEDDLKRATQLARRMVTHWGMSPAIGPVAFRSSEEHPFLGKEIREEREHSEATTHLIDEEIKRILSTADERAKAVLTEHRQSLEAMTRHLLEKEALSEDEITAIIGPATPRVFEPPANEQGPNS
jgi:cell division protease FtsH